MPQSQVFMLDDVDKFQAALRGGTYEVFVRSKGDFHGQLTRIDLQRLWMQGSETNLPWIISSANNPERAPLLFLADADQAALEESGTEVSTGEILFYRRGATKDSWTSGRSHLATMSLTHEDLAAAGEAINGRALMAPSNSYVMRPDPAAMARLVALHRAAGDLARTAPAILIAPGVAQALEQKLVHAMVACLGTDAPVDRRTCDWQHSKVIARLKRFLEARQYQPVYLAEMCAAMGVSERTLRTCCQEHFGMGPVRYLWLRRMHLARRSLLRADVSAMNVTTVATEYGFWELGRFSIEYRALFGESPSTTLRRQPDATPAQTAWQ